MPKKTRLVGEMRVGKLRVGEMRIYVPSHKPFPTQHVLACGHSCRDNAFLLYIVSNV